MIYYVILIVCIFVVIWLMAAYITLLIRSSAANATFDGWVGLPTFRFLLKNPIKFVYDESVYYTGLMRHEEFRFLGFGWSAITFKKEAKYASR